MEAISALQNDLDAVAKRQRTVGGSAREIAATIGLLSSLHDSLDGEDGADQIGARLAAALQKVSKSTKTIMKKNKELGGSLSKLGKSMDKALNADAIKIARPEAFSNKEGAISNSILEHLLHNGHLDLGQRFMKESGASLPQSKLDIYTTFNRVLTALKEHDVGPAISWVNRCSLEAGDRASDQLGSLEFKLHSLHFVDLIRQHERPLAISYAQQHFSKFGGTHIQEIKRLMTCLLYTWERLLQSPYADLTDPIRWFEATEFCVRENAVFAGLPAESPLALCVDAGCAALPKLIKVAAVVQDSDTLMQKDELPVEIELGAHRLYHSVFTCPVSRETASKDNPPMRLPCGHAICRESLQKIAKNSRRKFKCTYCPSEQLLMEAVALQF